MAIGDASKRMKALAKAINDSLMVGAMAYAQKRQDGSKPIVDHHFTAGNQSRYGWAPLSKDYFERKAGVANAGAHGGNFRGSRLDKHAGAIGGGGSNLPMLVNSGATRQAADSGDASISISGGIIRITFHLPSYAKWLHEGTPKMPKRSPVEPNDLDRKEVVEEMKRYLARFAGNGRTSSAVAPKPY